jgi:hypothetical protein
MAFGPTFWVNLVAIAVPFIVTALAALAFTRIGAPRTSRREPRP